MSQSRWGRAWSRALAETLAGIVVLGTPALAQQSDHVAQPPANSTIQGVVTAASGVGATTLLAGVTLQLTGGPLGQESLSAVTNEQGRYRFDHLRAGKYQLGAQVKDFRPFSKVVLLGPGDRRVENVVLHLKRVVQTVRVQDRAPLVATQSSTHVTQLSDQELLSLPLVLEKFEAALPLVPGVVRTSDGKLNFKGAPENQGMLLVDSAQTVDPVTGSFSIPVPLDATQTLNVSKAPYDTEYGGFSGGLTAIQTKPPSGRWHHGLMDFIPGFRGKGGHLVGVSDFTPRFFFGGPLVKKKLNFSEALTYDLRKHPVRGLAWPHNESKHESYDSLTSFQLLLSSRHLVSMNVNGFSNRVRYADINSLVPQPASSDEGQRGVSLGATDSYQFVSGALLSTLFRFTRFDSNAHGEGPEEMLITPDGRGGNFFNAWTRTSNQFEFLPLYRFPQKELWGRHELKVGADFTHREYHGTSHSHPIQLLREDGSLAERIDFQGGSRLRAQDTEMAEFVQDHWTLGERLALDLGARLTSQSLGRSAAFAPRAGLVFSPDADRKTIIRAGAGLFYDRFPLLAADFLDNPTRVVSLYDATGSLIQSQAFENAYVQETPAGGFVRTGRNLDTSPRNFTWNLEVDRELLRGMMLRASYLYSQTQNLYVVTPLAAATGASSLLGLSSQGGSHYHEFEATLHYRPNARTELNLSYVRSHARGDLSTLSDVFVPLEQPVIRPNLIGNFDQDVPNRVVGWGAFPLPWNLTFSPVVDVHSGFPYSPIDELQNYVGTPNSQRFPAFFSFDLKIYRVFRLGSLPLLGRFKDQKLRFGVYSINLTNHLNYLDVYANVASPNFGHFMGIQHRVDGLVIDLLN